MLAVASRLHSVHWTHFLSAGDANRNDRRTHMPERRIFAYALGLRTALKRTKARADVSPGAAQVAGCRTPPSVLGASLSSHVLLLYSERIDAPLHT